MNGIPLETSGFLPFFPIFFPLVVSEEGVRIIYFGVYVCVCVNVMGSIRYFPEEEEAAGGRRVRLSVWFFKKKQKQKTKNRK